MNGPDDIVTTYITHNYTSYLHYYTYFPTGTVTYYPTTYQGNESEVNPKYREYSMSKDADKVTSILLALLTVPGVLMSLVVTWNLFRGKSGLNKPTQQLHGHLMVANLLILLFCVPVMSLVLYKGRKSPGEKTGFYELPVIFCNINGFIWNAMTRITVHISTLTAVDRVLAVQFPIFYKFKINNLGYMPVLVFLWLLNFATAATPYYVYKYYILGLYECICSWNLNMLLLKTENPHIKSLIIYFYLFTLFTLPLILAIISCVWVIAVLLKKHLRVQVDTKQRPSSEERAPSCMYTELAVEGPRLKEPPGKRGSAGRMLPAIVRPQINRRRRSIKISIDSKIKRACVTMLMVLLLQFFSYSITQLMTIDHLLFSVYNTNIFFKDARNPIQDQLFLNYPLPIVTFSLLIPVLIHFRMFRRPSTGTSTSIRSSRLRSKFSISSYLKRVKRSSTMCSSA